MSGRVTWASISGGLIMPPEFESLLDQSHSLCMYCLSYHQEHLPCSCFRCGLWHEGDCVTVDSNDIIRQSSALASPSSRRLCMYCRAYHQEHLPCSCFRCGFRHEGDCATVCSRCHRVHPRDEVRCRSQRGIYFTSKRRCQALFSNVDDGIDHVPASKHSLGDMSIECPHCQSKSWLQEKINCCHAGDIVVEWDDDVPSELSELILSPHVQQNIRRYNTIMAFASTGHCNKTLIGGTFVLGGRTYHRIGSVLPGDFIIYLCYRAVL